MALRAGYYGLKRRFKDKLESIALAWDETISSLFLRSEQRILGAKNILDFEAWLKAAGMSYTVNDGVYTITTVKATKFQFASGDIDVIITGTVADGTASNARVVLYNASNEKVAEGVKNSTFSLKGRACKVAFTYGESGSITASQFMIRLATDPDDTYTSFALSNIKLTNQKMDKLKSFSMTTTTSAAGNFSIQASDIPYSAIILYADITSGATYGAMGIPYKNPSSEVQSVHVMAPDGTKLAETAIGVTLYYIDGVSDVIASRSIAPDTRSVEEIAEAPEEIEEQPVKKTTRKKSTAKADTKEEV